MIQINRSALASAHNQPLLVLKTRSERDEEKCEAVFRPHPALTFESITFYDFGLFQSKIIVI